VTTTVEIRIADLPWFHEFLERLREFVAEYCWHDRSCAAVDADGDWRLGNPACSCGYTEALAALIGELPT
jgi:hypothetical protein